MAAPEDYGYPVPYDGKITDVVLTVSSNSLTEDAAIRVYINKSLDISGRMLIHEFLVPAEAVGKWYMPKKKIPRMQKGDMIVVKYDATVQGTTGTFNPVVSIGYEKDESMRVKSKPVDNFTIPIS